MVSACGMCFYKNWYFMTMEACHKQKIFSPTPTKVLIKDKGINGRIKEGVQQKKIPTKKLAA